MRIASRLPGRWSGQWWRLVVPAVCGLLAALLATSGVRPQATWIGYVILAVLSAGWFFVGSRALHDGPLSVPVTVALVVAIVALCSLAPAMAVIQTIAYPYAWMSSAKRGRVIVANCAIAMAVVAGFGLQGPVAGASAADGFWVGVATAAVSLAFSFAMGIWITSIARQAAARAVLQARLDAVSEELAQAHRDAGAAAERERFAHEVHDTLTQTLTAVVMLTERAGEQMHRDPDAAASTIEIAERTARQALAETRSLIAEGRGTGVGADGLTVRIDRLCARFGEQAGVRVHTQISGALDALDRADQVVLLRCLQETLANVGKHARASNIVVNLDAGRGGVVLTVSDDGVGFPDSVEAASARGYGLSGMSSRLALAHGSLAVATGPAGTRVSVRLPAATEAGSTPAQADEQP